MRVTPVLARHRRPKDVTLVRLPESYASWLHRSYSKVWIATHEALAHLSSRGEHRFIKGSGQHIQLDNPQAVIDAADDVFRRLHARA